MKIEIINTGVELLQGRTLNTHAQWLGRQLTDHGHAVLQQVTVADAGPAIQAAVREALARAEGVITTGGLGPTSDDLTREHIARLLQKPLHEDPHVKGHLLDFYATRQRSVPGRVLLQAMVPDGATVLPNRHGTAPGLIVSLPPGRHNTAAAWLAMLPGPPRELRPMFTNQLLPWIEQQDPSREPFALRLFRCTGIGESQVEERVYADLQPWIDQGLDVAYCARPGEVDVRLSARGPQAVDQVAAAANVVRRALGVHVFSEGDTELETVVIRRLRNAGKTLAVAESCTGGHLSDRLTDVPGASEVFLRGWITYSNAAKRSCLGVPGDLLNAHGAVSETVAKAMAEGARQRAGADYALAITGIAGPTGATEGKPVGTVFVALAKAEGTSVIRRHNRWDRATFKHVTAQQALDLLRVELRAETA
jgi:nicotinamide-nucleotide amidase